MDDAILYAVAGIFGLVGLTMLGAGITFTISTMRFMANAEHTEGEVVELVGRESTSSDGPRTTVWYPTVEYAADGRLHTFEGRTGSRPPAYLKGAVVPVAYDPSDPSTARIASFRETHIWHIFFCVMGLGFIGAGFAWMTIIWA